MPDIAIKVENLSKKYHLGSAVSGNLRDTLAMGWNRLCGKASVTDKKEFWALQDVSFEVKKGEVIGIIGRNGAGKSTLLKILSRITEPTSGRVELNGRVASLLEVGTGFHPELSGRENIYLNGALLGMKRVEIKRKFDKIIDFSGVEEFIDTPVKKYSSGMYVRLAFAVAAHLEPEILLVDEVLAVGDAEFQKKCLGKMGEVAKGGRTVVFVSHNMEAIINLCPCSIYLEKGKFISKNYSEEIINQYSNLQSNNKLDGYLLKNHYSRYSSEIQIQKIKYQNKIFFITLSVTKAYEKIGVVFIIKNLNGLTIFKTSTSPIWSNKTFSISEKCHITLNLDNLHLISGNYILGLAITIPNERFLVEIDNAMLFSVNNHSIYEGSKILSNKTDGYIMTKHKWIIDST